MTLKESVMLKWLDRQEKHHRALQQHLSEKLFADGMLQVRNLITSRGWDATYQYVLDWLDKTKSERTVGSHLLHVLYVQLKDKMTSLNSMDEIHLTRELAKLG